MSIITDEMNECRLYCSLIHSAREKFGFTSLRYPLTDVKINRHFLPEYRDLIKDECNITGYLDDPAVEYISKDDELYGDHGKLRRHYGKMTDGDRSVWISLTKSQWQQDLFEDRTKKRKDALERKRQEENKTS